MISAKLEHMVKGWFVGSFKPAAFHTDACEVAVKVYKEGDCEAKHFHKIATEVTVVISGRIRMCDREWCAGDIVTLKPGEITDFFALTDVTSVVVKVPSVIDDKYII